MTTHIHPYIIAAFFTGFLFQSESALAKEYKDNIKPSTIECLDDQCIANTDPSSRLKRMRQAAEGDVLIKKINPKYGKPGFSNNCDFCANLFALALKTGTMGKYEKTGAIPFDPYKAEKSESYHLDYLQKNIELAHLVIGKDLDAARYGAESIKDVEAALMREAEGVFYIVKGYRPYSPGEAKMHSWVVFRIGSSIYHKCPQVGGNLPFAFSDFEFFTIYRVD